MDDFVCTILAECDLHHYIQRFKDEAIGAENIFSLSDHDLRELIPEMGPRARFRERLTFLKEEKNLTNQQTVDSSTQTRPSTSDTSNGKRKLDLQDKSDKSPTSKRRCDTYIQDEMTLPYVKDLMTRVHKKLPNQENNKLSIFVNHEITRKIEDLETDKSMLVGVFGKTGAGKSSLINAIIGEENLLPSGSISACTSVMIKVEANMQNSEQYEADIEFITKEEWEWELRHFLEVNAAQENDKDYEAFDEKMSALYGGEWKKKSVEYLMDEEHFREVDEFLKGNRKIFTCESAEELSEGFHRYIRNDKRSYWPLVRCATVRVPNNDLLQHVTLVDLPGNGDCNKIRNEKWKKVVGSCSTVWIVTECNRAAAEQEAWEILERASSLMGNGGQCQQIHFICSKSDLIGDSNKCSAADRCAQTKQMVREKFSKQEKIKRQFNDDCFKVFTVSSKEFLKKKHLNPDETEIPKLKEYLQSRNDSHSKTLNYVSGAVGILSLIQGASCGKVAGKTTNVCRDLEEQIRNELDKVGKPMKEAYKAFGKSLSDGVEKSKRSCEEATESFLYPRELTTGRGFHRTLKFVFENKGTYESKTWGKLDLNEKLASCLTDSIDEEFKKTFPNDGKSGFYMVINMFSLDIKNLIQKYKDVELQLTFLKTEEKRIQKEVKEMTLTKKKKIYSSLMTSIKNSMEECYKEAAEHQGPGKLDNMRKTIEEHVQHSKDTMFEKAKNDMLSKLKLLMEEILRTLKGDMQKSIELSLKTDCDSIPDVTTELAKVKRCYNDLKKKTDKETSQVCDPPGPAADSDPWIKTEYSNSG